MGKAATIGKMPAPGQDTGARRPPRADPGRLAMSRGGEPDRPSPSFADRRDFRRDDYCRSALTSAGSSKTDASMGSVLMDLTIISIC